jgi:hypothetical protein
MTMTATLLPKIFTTSLLTKNIDNNMILPFQSNSEVSVNDLNVSSRSKPDLGGWNKAGVELVVEIANVLVVVLVSDLVERVGGVTPPSVEQEGEEEGDDYSGVKAVGVDVKDSVSLEG